MAIAIAFWLCQSMTITAQQATTIQPRWSVEAGFNLPELYNYGFEINGNYYPYHLGNRLRIGPALQAMYFFSPYRVWFPSNNNIGSGLFSELHLNAMANIEFQPFKKSSFFIGIAPFIGWQSIINQGKMENTALGVSGSSSRTIHFFNWGSRYKIGGFLGKQQRIGLQAHFQMSHRGLTDKNPMTKGFHLGYADYKSFVGLSFIYKLK